MIAGHSRQQARPEALLPSGFAGSLAMWTLIVAPLAGAVLATLIDPPRPLLLWNASASSPVGLYRVSWNGELQRGDRVAAWAPASARALAADRHYVPRDVPLVKPVAARAGDKVCAVGDAISVNRRLVVRRRRVDPVGRRLPWWTGCRLLGPGQFFLLSADQPLAFDGRYFGVTVAAQIVGRAKLLWPR